MLFTFPGMEIKGPLETMLPPDQIARFGVQLGITSQLYLAQMARLVEPHGLTYPQFALLVHLARRSTPNRISEMASAVELTQSAVTKAVQKFHGMGLVTVETDPQDARGRLVAMTDKGRAHVGAVQRGFGPAFAGMLQGWSAEEISRLTDDLARLCRWLQAATPPTDG